MRYWRCIKGSNDFYTQRIYKTNTKSNSTIIIYVVQSEKDADIKVFDTSKKRQAKNNDGVWFFEKKDNKKNINVFFSDKESDADLKVFFVDNRRKAGWKNYNKKPLLY